MLDETRILEQLMRIEQRLAEIASERQTQAYYSTDEIAELLGRRPYTVRRWAREKRINAEKKMSGRGQSKEWAISHEELERIKSHGLLPKPRWTY